jgi:hypothetical protein
MSGYLADNVEDAPEYIKAVAEKPELETLYYRDGEGLGVHRLDIGAGNCH